MKITLQTRKWLVLELMAFAFLSIAVFGWGLHYKLSLYQSEASIGQSSPAAKLLSQKEQAEPAISAEERSDGLAHTALPHLPWLAALALMFWGIHLPLRRGCPTVPLSASLQGRLQHWRSALFLRPPPALSFVR